MSRVTRSLVRARALRFVFNGPSNAALAPRAGSSAVSPVLANWHQTEFERRIVDLKRDGGDVDLFLVGDSIAVLWPVKGPRNHAALQPGETGGRLWRDAARPTLLDGFRSDTWWRFS